MQRTLPTWGEMGERVVPVLHDQIRRVTGAPYENRVEVGGDVVVRKHFEQGRAVGQRCNLLHVDERGVRGGCRKHVVKRDLDAPSLVERLWIHPNRSNNRDKDVPGTHRAHTCRHDAECETRKCSIRSLVVSIFIVSFYALDDTCGLKCKTPDFERSVTQWRNGWLQWTCLGLLLRDLGIQEHRSCNATE